MLSLLFSSSWVFGRLVLVRVSKHTYRGPNSSSFSVCISLVILHSVNYLIFLFQVEFHFWFLISLLGIDDIGDLSIVLIVFGLCEVGQSERGDHNEYDGG